MTTNELRKIAEKSEANKSYWGQNFHRSLENTDNGKQIIMSASGPFYFGDTSENLTKMAADIEFISTFSPTLILKLLDELKEAREALIYIRSSDMSKYELGFDYGEDHKRLGKAKSGSRWITPEERAQVFLNKYKEIGRE